MKKYFGIILAAMLMVGAAGQAMAYFADTTHLVRVVFNRNGQVEVATDLGFTAANLAATAPNANLAVGGGAAAFNVGMVTGAGSMADLWVAYFAMDTANQAWLAGTSPIVAGARKGTGLFTNVSNIDFNYNQLGGATGTVVLPQSAANAYTSLFNATTLGGYGNYVNQTSDLQFGTEVSLANLAAADGFIDQTLYYFSAANTASTGVATVTLRTLVDANGNGYTVINPSAVPIPPSVLLLGSGLLGMIGIRRKFSV